MEETQLVHVTVRDEHVLVKSHRDSNGYVSIVIVDVSPISKRMYK